MRSQGSWASRMLARLLWSSATNCSSLGEAEIKRTHLSDLVMHFHESLVINYKARALKTWAEAWQALLSDLSFAFKRCEYQRDPSLCLTGSISSLPDMKIFLFLSSVCVGGGGLGESAVLEFWNTSLEGRDNNLLLSLFCFHILVRMAGACITFYIKFHIVWLHISILNDTQQDSSSNGVPCDGLVIHICVCIINTYRYTIILKSSLVYLFISFLSE